MPHAFRIGPLASPDGAVYLYSAMEPSGRLETVQSSDDLDGLQKLSAALPGQSLTVEPALAKAGKQLGWRRRPLPAEVAHAKATMALSLALAASDMLARDVRPALIGDMLDASIAFMRAAPWRFIDGDTPLRVDVYDRGKLRTMEGSLMGQGGVEFGFLVYAEPGTLQRLMSADPRQAQKLAKRVDMLAISMEQEPQWAVKTIEHALGTAVVPLPMHSKGGRYRPVTSREVATLTASLRAASEIVAGAHEVRSKSGGEPQVEVVLHLPARIEPPPPMYARQPTPASEKVSRNAPCPCGSGRKYKRCCLVEDSPTRAAPTPASTDDVALVLRIVAYADARFPGWREPLPPPWSTLAAMRMGNQLLMPLLAFQHPVRPGLSAVRAFIAEHGRSFGRETLEIVKAELDAELSVWEVLEVSPGVGMSMLDLLTGDERFVYEVSGSRGLVVRDAVLARVVTERGRSTFSGLHPRPLPPAAAHAVVSAVRQHLGLRTLKVPRRRLPPSAIIDPLLSEWHAACDSIEEEVRVVDRDVQTTDGEPFEPHEDHFAFASSARTEVIAAVMAQPGVQVDEDRRSRLEVTFTKPGNAMHPHWHNTVIGTATIEARTLKLEANSQARIDRLREALEQALGSRLEHRERKRLPVKKIKGNAGDGPVAIDAMAMRGLWTPDPELMMREQARHWIETPWSALDGLTPRQAAAKAASRRKLHQALKEMENGSARAGSPDFVGYVRHDLELSRTGEPEQIDAQDRRLGRGRKISETLLDFATPLLQALEETSDLRPALELAALVWNAHVLEHDGHGHGIDERLRQACADTDLAGTAAWIETLWARRRFFAADARLIEVRQVQWNDGHPRVQAAALLGPPPRPRASRRRAKGQGDLFE